MNKQILVIDDEKPTLKIFRMLLATYGYEILTAENGQEGLELFREKRPNLVLTDIKMPVMDGIEVLRNIKEINPHTEVVVITGHGDMDLAVQALNLDATDFINKPVQRQVLEKALKRAEERLAISRREEEQVVLAQDNDETEIRIRGNISALTVAPLREAFNRAKAKNGKLSVRFEKSVSINGAGISALSDCLGECRNLGMHVQLSGLSSNFRTVFEMVGITRLAKLVDDIVPAVDGN
ncbi:MAG: response regulator [Desulfovibrionaceae bacterium]